MPPNTAPSSEVMSLACNFKGKTQMRGHVIAFMGSIYTLSFVEKVGWYLPLFNVYHPRKTVQTRVVKATK